MLCRDFVFAPTADFFGVGDTWFCENEISFFAVQEERCCHWCFWIPVPVIREESVGLIRLWFCVLDLWLEGCRFDSGFVRSKWDYFHMFCFVFLSFGRETKPRPCVNHRMVPACTNKHFPWHSKWYRWHAKWIWYKFESLRLNFCSCWFYPLWYIIILIHFFTEQQTNNHN